VLVTYHRAGSWPAGAPTQAEARATAEAIGDRLGRRGRSAGLPRPSIVVVTGNRRQQLSIRRSGDWYELRLGLAMLPEGDLVVESVIAQLRTGRFPDALHDFIGAVEPADVRVLPAAETPKCLADSLGRALALVPDLHDSAPHIEIEWSRSATKKQRRSIRLGSASPSGRIRIHPLLESPSVPEYVLDMVVYHELCHCLAPPMMADQARRTGERRIHHSKFRALEARCPRLGEANAWVRENLDSLLRPC
jgi:hypothetical protein